MSLAFCLSCTYCFYIVLQLMFEWKKANSSMMQRLRMTIYRVSLKITAVSASLLQIDYIVALQNLTTGFYLCCLQLKSFFNSSYLTKLSVTPSPLVHTTQITDDLRNYSLDLRALLI